MTEETTPQVSPSETPKPTTESAPTAPSWADLVGTVAPDDLRKHPRIAGIVGEAMQRAREQAKRELQEDNQKAAEAKAEQDLLDLARSDSERFAERYLTEHERTKIQQQVESARGDALQRIAKSVGKSVTSLPEWAELSQEDYQRLVAAVQDKGEEEAIPVYNATVLEILAERRANKKLAVWREKELAKEREAIRAEEKAQGAARHPAPSMRQGSTAGEVDIDGMSDKEFDAWWKRRMGR